MMYVVKRPKCQKLSCGIKVSKCNQIIVSRALQFGWGFSFTSSTSEIEFKLIPRLVRLVLYGVTESITGFPNYLEHAPARRSGPLS
jgi:hypothetical protein